MRHRSHLSRQERRSRSELAKLVHEAPLARGTVVTMARTCGSSGCKCARGEKHVSLYLSVRYKGKRKMIYIPTEWEEQVQEWVKNHQEMSKLLELVSDATIERFMKEKEDNR